MEKKQKLVLFSLLAAAVVVAATAIILIVVLGKKPEKIELVAGTYDTVFVQGEELDFYELEIKYTDKKGKAATVSYGDDGSGITYTPFSTAAVSSGIEVTFTYKGLEAKETMKVEAAAAGVNVGAGSLTTPEFIADYLQYIDIQSEGNAFAYTDDPYYVGTDNAFVMKPVATFRKIVGERYAAGGTPILPASVLPADASVPLTVTVSEKAGEDWTALTGTALTGTVDVDSAACSFLFKAAAVGKTYKVRLAAVANYFEHIFKVVEGYNIQSKAELVMFDNRDVNKDESGEYMKIRALDTDPGMIDPWADIRAGAGLPSSADISGRVILHRDIKLTKEDLPEMFFFADGSMGNRIFPLYRAIALDEEFEFIGNYFNIDASALPKITHHGNSPEPSTDALYNIESNSALIRFNGVGHNNDSEDPLYRHDYNSGTARIKNLSLYGNAPRGDDESFLGGIQGINCSTRLTYVTNVLSKTFHMNYNFDASVLDIDGNEVTGDDGAYAYLGGLRSYDSFSNMLYCWKVDNIFAENCVFENSGGPCIIIAQPSTGDDVTPTAHITVFTMDSYTLEHLNTTVSGTESWFTFNGGSAASMEIRRISEEAVTPYTGGARSLYIQAAEDTPELFNFKLLVMPAQLGYPFRPQAVVRLDSGEVLLDTAGFEGWSGGLEGFYLNGIPVLQSYGDDPIGSGEMHGAAPVGPGDAYVLLTAGFTPATPTAAFAQGDYFNVFLPFGGTSVGLMIKYF
ncbi:MAG: hypothetical protein FWE62_02020 [Firmicutes bacterium]|nr:hypothetical protein [Bacillota bacterium]